MFHCSINTISQLSLKLMGQWNICRSGIYNPWELVEFGDFVVKKGRENGYERWIAVFTTYVIATYK